MPPLSLNGLTLLEPTAPACLAYGMIYIGSTKEDDAGIVKDPLLSTASET